MHSLIQTLDFKMLRNIITCTSFVLLLLFLGMANAKTINVPAISAVKAIELAEKHLKTKKINVSRHFLAKAEYIGLYDEYNKPFWRIEWHLLARHTDGNQIYALIYPDGNVSVTFGE